jgi:hypothetical protein
MGPPRRLDAGSGARRPVEAATNHPDPRPLERRRPPEPPQYRAAVPPFPPAQPPFPPAAQAPFRPPTPAAEPETAPQDPPSGPAAADSPAGARQAGTSIEAGDSQDEADKSAEEGGSSGADNGVAGAGTGEPVAEGEHEHPSSRGNGTGPNGRVANDPDEGKMDPSGRGLVRRVPGAQMPAGALAARPGTPTQAPPDTAEQDAAAARSLVEEFEAGVQRALRDAPGTVETDEDGVR